MQWITQVPAVSHHHGLLFWVDTPWAQQTLNITASVIMDYQWIYMYRDIHTTGAIVCPNLNICVSDLWLKVLFLYTLRAHNGTCSINLLVYIFTVNLHHKSPSRLNLHKSDIFFCYFLVSSSFYFWWIISITQFSSVVQMPVNSSSFSTRLTI